MKKYNILFGDGHKRNETIICDGKSGSHMHAQLQIHFVLMLEGTET